MFRQTTVFCITALMVLSAVSYSQTELETQAQDESVLDLMLKADQSKRSSGSSTFGGRGGYGSGEISPGQKAKNQLGMAQQRLTEAEGEEAKQQAIGEMRKALSAYFDTDLDKRQSELAAIKKRVEKMEGQLQKRVDAKEDIIALRLQVLINNADGLGWSGAGFKEKPYPSNQIVEDISVSP